MEEMIKKLSFFKKIESIEEIQEGYHIRKKYKVMADKTNYFVKIEPKYRSQEFIHQLKETIDRFKQVEIPCQDLLAVYSFEEENQTVYIYNFIDGTNLEKYDCNLETRQEFGRKVANYMKRLETIDTKNIPIKSLEKFVEERNNCLKVIISAIENKKINHIISLEEIKQIQAKFLELSHSIQIQKPHLIHGDIKSANIMVTKNLDLSIVDIDFFELADYFFDVQYVIFFIFLTDEKKKKEKLFIKGYLEELYKTRPIEQFKRELLFIFLSDVIHVLKEEVENLPRLEKYMLNIKETILKSIANEDYLLNLFLE